MINIFLFLAFVFAATFIIGRIIEKFRVPWIFGALLVGFLLAIKNPFSAITSSNTFSFLADLGLYFLLFVIGFEIDLKEMLKEGKFIVKSTIVITLSGALFGALIIHFFFGYNWILSSIVGLSFATVGEAILIPILEEFSLVNTNLGRGILGVGVLDDVFEILALILVVLVIGVGASNFNVITVVGSLFILLLLTFTFQLFRKEKLRFKFPDIEVLFFFSLAVLFVFIGIGEYADAASIGALFAGISLATYLPKSRYTSIKEIVKSICYGFFAPIFFLYVGLLTNMSYLLSAPVLIAVVVIGTSLAKIGASYIMAYKKFGFKDSTLLGIGLSVRFSTSMIVITLLLKAKLISNEIFSVIVASSAILTFVIPIIFSYTIVKWGLAKKKTSS